MANYQDERMMKCPYCQRLFWITAEEQHSNETFECPHCHRSNAGSSEADKYGVLIGVSIVDCQLQELVGL